MGANFTKSPCCGARVRDDAGGGYCSSCFAGVGVRESDGAYCLVCATELDSEGTCPTCN